MRWKFLGSLSPGIFRQDQIDRDRLCRSPVLPVIVVLLGLLGCQKDPPPAQISPDGDVGAPMVHQAAVPPEEISPALKAESPPVKIPLDLSLPQGSAEDFQALPEEREPSELPDFFNSENREASGISGKLLFQEDQEGGALDNISGAQLEVNIPVE